jgi:hypothetical protein
MTTLVANEIRKLRTLRGPWLLLAAGPVLAIVGVAEQVAGGADLTQPQTAIHAVAHAGVMTLLTLVFGITVVAGEYRHKTITDTQLATPRRGRVIAAKFTVYAAIGVSLGRVDLQPGRRHRHRPRLDRARRRADRNSSATSRRGCRSPAVKLSAACPAPPTFPKGPVDSCSPATRSSSPR